MAGEYIFNLKGLSKQHGTKTILDDIQLAFFFGAKIGVIGPNGSGKSSLLKIMAGVDADYMGDVQVAKSAKIGYLEQEPLAECQLTVTEVVQEGVAEAQAILDRYDAIWDEMANASSDEEQDKLTAESGRLQDIIDRRDLWSLDHQVEMAMEALRLPPGDMAVQKISGGERRRVAMCKLLLTNPDVLLLDEPTNHLDAESVGWLETYLKSYTGTLVVVTHDRYFLSNVTEWILELQDGRGFPYKGNYERWLEQKQEVMEREAKMVESRKKLLAQELEWVRLNANARRSRNKARIKRYEELAAQEVDTRESNLQIQIPSGERLGDLVIEAKGLSKSFGDRVIMEEVDFKLPPGGIVGVIGGNGAGKTTLFRMIMGEEEASSGSLRIGPTVQLSYVDQNRDALNDENTIFEEISEGRETIELGSREMNARAYCARFNIKGADQQKKVGRLSGGERNRVHLAKLLKSGGNVLLLDEPTNDLDVATLRSLEEGLMNFGGCAVIISHRSLCF